MRQLGARSTRPEGVRSPASCSDLEEMELWNTDGCCPTCHSAERMAGGGLWIGPCSTETNGMRVACCCSVRKASGGG